MMSFSLAVSKKERMINIIHEFILIRGNLYLKSVFILISRTEGTEGEGLGQGHGLRTPNESINQRNLKIWADVADNQLYFFDLEL